MNLLNQNAQTDKKSKLYAKMLSLLSEANLSDENMKIANEFLDFNNEINLELLNNVTPQDFSKVTTWQARWHSTEMIDDYYGKKTKFDLEYIDRYVLLLEAVYGIQSFHFVWENINRQDGLIYIEDIIRAFSRRYSPDESWSRMVTIIAEALYEDIPECLVQIAKSKGAKILIDAGIKQFGVHFICDAKWRTELKLYAAALISIEPEDLTKDEELSKVSKVALEHIVSALNEKNTNNKPNFWFMMALAFVAAKFSRPIEMKMKLRMSGKNEEALIGVLKLLDSDYINDNIERLYRIFDINENEKLTEKYIETAMAFAFLDNSNRAIDFLGNISVTHPKEFIEVMTTNRKISSCEGNTMYEKKNSLYYLPQMYQIISSQNDEALKEAGFVYKDALLEAAVKLSQYRSKIARTEIEEYLFGKSNLDVLKPYFNSIFKTFSTNFIPNDFLISECIKMNPDFANRYYTLLALVQPTELGCIMRKTNDGKSPEVKFKTRTNLVESFATAFEEEKLPEEYRFKAYDEMFYAFTSYYDVENGEIDRYIRKIAEVTTGEAEKYAFCKNLDIISRKIYVIFLDINNENNKYKDEILAMCADSSKEVRNIVVSIVAKNKENESDVLKMLKAKKGATREAALSIIDLWGAENYNDILLEMSETEKVAKILDKIQSLLASAVSGSSKGENAVSTSALVENIHKGGRYKKVIWLFETPNSIVHFTNGSIADDKYLQAILLCYAGMTNFRISEEANMLAQDLNKTELENFALEIFLKWIQEGAESKKKWVLYFASIHGGFNMIEVFQKYIKEWSEVSRGAIAAEAVTALALNGSSDALMAVDNIAHKFKHKQVKSAANKALQNAADALGITSEELGDRIVPNLGFDENMERIFDYGTRKFKVYLNAALELEVYDEKDKKLKTLPSVGAKDTEEIAKASNAEFKQMKKQLKNVVSIQKVRLETAMLADRRWDVTAWENLFVKNPVMHKFAMGLIWTAYENDEAVQTFRYMEDGTFNTSDEDEYTLPNGCTIGLAHPIDLDEETLSAWKEQLSDYEIIQPIEQLEKQVYTVTDEEKGELDLTRFNGRKINGYSLLGRMTKMGWYKGSIQDAGCFYEFYREDITKRTDMGNGVIKLDGNGVELQFSGMYVAGDDDMVEIERVRFYNPGAVEHGSYVYDEADDEKAIKLDRISPRYFSEIVYQLEAILKTTEE